MLFLKKRRSVSDRSRRVRTKQADTHKATSKTMNIAVRKADMLRSSKDISNAYEYERKEIVVVRKPA